jgi:hypothetical protein
MKKLFTLVALLAMFLGANAQGGKWVEAYNIDYSTYQGFPFYVMGYVPEFSNGCMTDFGAMYKYVTLDNEAGETSDVIVKTANGVEYYKIALSDPAWHQYFIADGIQTKIDGKYKVVAKVKASAAVNINVNMGWGWGDGQQTGTSVAIPEGADFQEVEWEYSGIGGASCNLVAQPGTCAETIEWLNLTVYEWVKDGQRPKEWIEDLTNGDAETPWTEEQAAIRFNDMEQNFNICAWSKERGVNMNENGGWDPFVAPIEVEEGTTNHVFVCHGQAATTEGDAAAWDNQFWIQSKHAWKSGTTLKIKFRYKCDYAGGEVKTNTQVHKQTPSDYLIWHAIGDITFTNEWKTFDGNMTIADDMANGWSIAFNLNPNVKDAVNFYFDDLSWQYLKLDEGFFVSGINATTTTSYDDLDNAIQFTAGDDGVLEAIVGEKGNAASYVDQIMISTTRGDDQAFKGATLKPQGKIHDDADEWLDYAASTNAKLDLPGLGVWKIWIDTEYNAMAFQMIEGTKYEEPDPVAIVTNKTEIVVKGKEREDLKDNKNNDTGEITVREEADDPNGATVGGEGHNGQTWDNQFFIKANRALKKDEVTTLKFKFKSSVADAKTTTQCHGETPGSYMHWAAIGDVVFQNGEWEDFEKEFKVPAEADGMWNIAFNMAEIKAACDYYITEVQWFLKDDALNAEGQTMENLISEEGTANFFVKEGAGTEPYQFGTDPSGIKNVVNNSNNGSAVIYNIAGQRVSKDYKGLVIKEGKKYVVK